MQNIFPKIKQLITIFIIFFDMFLQHPFKYLMVISGVLSMFAPLTIWPYIFYKFVIPRIEQQVGVRLEYASSFSKKIPMFVYKYAQVISYIIIKYTMLKFMKRPSESIILRSSNALQRINYRLEDAPKFVIVISFLAWLSCLWFIIFVMFIYFKMI
jgi:hypothetical protein